MNKTCTETELESFLKEKKSLKDKIFLVIKMGIPVVLAQLTSIMMEYIDAAMVGSLGGAATASIGLVSTSTWLVNGLLLGLTQGFSVQCAQSLGAGNIKHAKNIFRHALIIMLSLSLLVAIIGITISPCLPVWLHGDPLIQRDSEIYFLIFSLSLPFCLLRQLSSLMLQSQGNMKTPSSLSALICLLDVLFNFVFIFPGRNLCLFGMQIFIPGFGMGVMGAAIGTALSETVIGIFALFILLFRSRISFLKSADIGVFPDPGIIKKAFGISVPLSLDHVFMCSAYVMGTLIISPLGTVSIAANTLAVTAESLCYMPGYGISSAAAALIGQSAGAKRKDLVKDFSRISVYLGMVIMAFFGIMMYFLCPLAFSILSSDPDVRVLGCNCLRIELFSEPLYAAGIVSSGVFRGMGDTIFPSLVNLSCMWGIRIILSFFLINFFAFGLQGYWIAMAADLSLKGIIMLIRLYSGKWEKY